MGLVGGVGRGMGVGGISWERWWCMLCFCWLGVLLFYSFWAGVHDFLGVLNQ